jgi:hypothetical protein
LVETKKEDRNIKARKDKIVKERVKRATFAAVEEQEAKEIHDVTQGILDDKRRNYVQALKDYAMFSMNLDQQIEYHRMWEESIATKDSLGKELKDENGVVFSEAFKIMRAKQLYVQIRFDVASLEQSKIDIMKTWNVDDKKIDKQINDWILGKQKIY